VTVEMDGSVRIDWAGDDQNLIRVYAPWRSEDELTAFARRVADLALLNRTVPDLSAALRAEFDGTFDLDTREPEAQDGEAAVVVSLHPAAGTPNPDE
jgi:hypothetical protein